MFILIVKVADPHTSFPLTRHHAQRGLVDLIVEPAGDVHAAAVHARVALLHLHEGEGDVPRPTEPEEPVALAPSADHFAPVRPEHLVAAAPGGDGPAAPAHPQRAVLHRVVGAGQRHVLAHPGHHCALSADAS